MTDRVTDGEEAIVQRYLAPLAAAYPGAFGLLDDCATIRAPEGHELVVTTDALVEGVHFLPGESADAIGWKALAVNVSDLAAKGAMPLAYVMGLALPEAPRAEWMHALAGGLARAQQSFAITLAGGDTDRTPGHLGLSITAFGTIPAGRMVRRNGARPGDRLYVSGTIGDAALGLRLLREPSLAAAWGLDETQALHLLDRLRYPSPPVALAGVVADLASAAMDISDGLAKDLGRLCRASGAGAVVERDKLPVSQAARQVLARRGATVAELVSGGEDYEILLAVKAARCAALEDAARAAGAPCTMIGQICAGSGISLIDSAGRPIPLGRQGWDHFQPSG